MNSTVKNLLLFLPNLVKLVSRLVADGRVPTRHKAILAGVLAYVVVPTDLIPDVIPGLGQVDDLLLLAVALDGLINEVGPGIVEEHWDGQEGILQTIKAVLATTTRFVPSELRRVLYRNARHRPESSTPEAD